MAARSYIQNRSERIARVTGEAWEFAINEGDSYRCRIGLPGPAIQAATIEVQRRLMAGAFGPEGGVAELLLREIVDESMHDRLHNEFRSTDPKLMIVLNDQEAAEIVRDFIEFLGGGEIPFVSSGSSSDTPSTTGGTSVPTLPPAVEIPTS